MSDAGDDDWEGWEEEEGDRVPCTCLLCPSVFPAPAEAFAHLVAAHGCDVLRARDAMKLDFYGCIKLINYIRRWHADHPEEVFTIPPAAAFKNDSYLQPVLDSDPLLQYDFQPDELEEPQEQDLAESAPWLRQEAIPGSDMVAVARDDLVALFARLHAAESNVEKMRLSFLSFREAAEESMLGGAKAAELRDDKSDVVARPAAAAADDNSDEEADRAMDGYFQSYAHYGIHEEMLKDTVRTESYRDAMLRNPELFAGKVVLDVGCGTSILSMFAARAGARKVYAVDNSSIASLAREIVKKNGLDGVIEIIRGKMEEVTIPEKVDIIVSEWMGYGLLFESMLDSVLYARDKYLNPGGVVLPDKTAIYVVGLSDPAAHDDHLAFWKDVYSFDLTPMLAPVLGEAVVMIVPPAAVATAPGTLVSLDLLSCKVADTMFTAPFNITSSKQGPLTAFCIYFDIVFEEGCANQVYFSTSPGDIPTHWKQAVFYLPQPVAMGVGDVISGTIAFERAADNQRALTIRVVYSVASLEGTSAPASTHVYRL